MSRGVKAIHVLLAVAGLVTGVACKEPAQPGKPGNGGKNGSGDGRRTGTDTSLQTGNPQTGGSNPCGTSLGTGTLTVAGTGTATGGGILLADPDGGSVAGQIEDEGGIWLTATVSYEGQIRNIINGRCVSCHGAGGRPNTPDLSTYLAAKAAATSSLSAIQRGSMPKGGTKLSAVETQAWQDWVNSGLLERDTTLPGGTNTAVTGGSTTNPCNTATSTGTGTGTSVVTDDLNDAWQTFLNPPELGTCKTQNRLYDREKKACHKAAIATDFNCARDGIVAKFKTIGIEAGQDLDQLAGQGWVIDQCGQGAADDPIVMLYKKETTDTELKLAIKRLCKNGSLVCK